MANKTVKKSMSLDEVKDKFISKTGSPKRDKYELELRLDLIGQMIKEVRKEQKLTQDELGKLVGVQKAQISKLESGSINVTVATILKVFEALKAEVKFHVEVNNKAFAIK